MQRWSRWRCIVLNYVVYAISSVYNGLDRCGSINNSGQKNEPLVGSVIGKLERILRSSWFSAMSLE